MITAQKITIIMIDQHSAIYCKPLSEGLILLQLCHLHQGVLGILLKRRRTVVIVTDREDFLQRADKVRAFLSSCSI